MKFIILEEYRKGGAHTWKNTFSSFEDAEKAVLEEIGEKYIQYYERWHNSWCGTEKSYSIIEIND